MKSAGLLGYEPTGGIWEPSTDAKSHTGGSLDPKKLFFNRPPENLGSVITAESTLDRGKDGISFGRRAAILTVILAGCVFAGLILAAASPGKAYQFFGIFGLVIGAFVGLVWWKITRFDPICSYVGSEGIARYQVFGHLANRPIARVLLFLDATELRISLKRVYAYGIYSHTDFRFKWSNDAAKTVYEFRGTFKSKDGTPTPGDRYWFARSAERVWTKWLMAVARSSIATNGYCQFNGLGGTFLRLGPESVELVRSGKAMRLALKDIESTYTKDGTFYILAKSPVRYTRDGEIHFNLENMSNVLLFEMLFREFLPSPRTAG